MFKIIALAGLMTGGAGYAAYEYTDLFGCKGKTCSLANTRQADAAKPSCCQTGADCCEAGASCCNSAKVAAKPAACCQSGEACCEAPKTTTGIAQVAACCGNPCVACALLACEACADCATCCGTESAKVAAGGPAALVPVKPAK